MRKRLRKTFIFNPMRLFSSALNSVFSNVKPFRPMPNLHPDDQDRVIRNVRGFFEHMLLSAPQLENGRLQLSQTDLRKLIFLSKSSEDLDAVLDAMWTWCGNKVWPKDSTWDFCVQLGVNVNEPEKVRDIVLNSYKLLYYPKTRTLNNYFFGLYEKENYEQLRDDASQLDKLQKVKLDELSYVVATKASIAMDDSFRALRFFNKLGKFGNPEFEPILEELRQEMTDKGYFKTEEEEEPEKEGEEDN